jgi:hypothetical protein
MNNETSEKKLYGFAMIVVLGVGVAVIGVILSISAVFVQLVVTDTDSSTITTLCTVGLTCLAVGIGEVFGAYTCGSIIGRQMQSHDTDGGEA